MQIRNLEVFKLALDQNCCSFSQAPPISNRDHLKSSTSKVHTPHGDDILHATIGVELGCLYLYPTLKTFVATESVMQLISIVGFNTETGFPPNPARVTFTVNLWPQSHLVEIPVYPSHDQPIES